MIQPSLKRCAVVKVIGWAILTGENMVLTQQQFEAKTHEPERKTTASALSFLLILAANIWILIHLLL